MSSSFSLSTDNHYTFKSQNSPVEVFVLKEITEKILKYRKNLFVFKTEEEMKKASSAHIRANLHRFLSVKALGVLIIQAYNELVSKKPDGVDVTLEINQNDDYPVIHLQVVDSDKKLHFSLMSMSLTPEVLANLIKSHEAEDGIEKADNITEYILVEESFKNVGFVLLKLLLDVGNISQQHDTHLIKAVASHEITNPKILQYSDLKTGHLILINFQPLKS